MLREFGAHISIAAILVVEMFLLYSYFSCGMMVVAQCECFVSIGGDVAVAIDARRPPSPIGEYKSRCEERSRRSAIAPSIYFFSN